jgi:hypothetical protein
MVGVDLVDHAGKITAEFAVGGGLRDGIVRERVRSRKSPSKTISYDFRTIRSEHHIPVARKSALASGSSARFCFRGLRSKLPDEFIGTRAICSISKHSLASQRMFAESLLSEQDFCPKTGGHFSEILLRTFSSEADAGSR